MEQVIATDYWMKMAKLAQLAALMVKCPGLHESWTDEAQKKVTKVIHNTGWCACDGTGKVPKYPRLRKECRASAGVLEVNVLKVRDTKEETAHQQKFHEEHCRCAGRRYTLDGSLEALVKSIPARWHLDKVPTGYVVGEWPVPFRGGVIVKSREGTPAEALLSALCAAEKL